MRTIYTRQPTIVCGQLDRVYRPNYPGQLTRLRLTPRPTERKRSERKGGAGTGGRVIPSRVTRSRPRDEAETYPDGDCSPIAGELDRPAILRDPPAKARRRPTSLASIQRQTNVPSPCDVWPHGANPGGFRDRNSLAFSAENRARNTESRAAVSSRGLQPNIRVTDSPCVQPTIVFHRATRREIAVETGRDFGESIATVPSGVDPK